MRRGRDSLEPVSVARDPDELARSDRGCHSLAYSVALPGNTDRQGKQKTAAPTAGILSPRQAPNLTPRIVTHRSLPRLRRVIAHRPTMTSRRHRPCRRRHHPPSSRAPRDVPAERRQESCRFPERRPAGVQPPVSPADRHRHRDRARRGRRRWPIPSPRGGRDQGRRRRRTGRLEHIELHLQRQALRLAGPLLRRHRVEIYSPNATWSKVKAAAQGANVLIYLGHGNG